MFTTEEISGCSGITVTKFAYSERDYNYVDFRLDMPIMNAFSEHGEKEVTQVADTDSYLKGMCQPEVCMHTCCTVNSAYYPLIPNIWDHNNATDRFSWKPKVSHAVSNGLKIYLIKTGV